MPTYEYVCTDCQNEWEEIQKISEAPVEVCPKCGKSTAKRQISGGNFILKGGGWYADLYSSPKSNGKPESKPEGSPASGSSGDKKPESPKPAEKKTESTSGSSGSSGSPSGSSGSSS